MRAKLAGRHATAGGHAAKAMKGSFLRILTPHTLSGTPSTGESVFPQDRLRRNQATLRFRTSSWVIFFAAA